MYVISVNINNFSTRNPK